MGVLDDEYVPDNEMIAGPGDSATIPEPPPNWRESVPTLTNMAQYKGKPNVLFADEETGELVRYDEKGQEAFREQGQIPIKAKPPGKRPSDTDLTEMDFMKIAGPEIEKEAENYAASVASDYEKSVPYSTRANMKDGVFEMKKADLIARAKDEKRKELVSSLSYEFRKKQAIDEKKRLEKIKETPLGFDKTNRPVGKNNTTGDLVYQDTGEPYKGGPLQPLTATKQTDTTIPEMDSMATSLSGERDERALSGLTSGQAAVVKGLVDYSYDLPSGMALKTPYWQGILERAMKYDPTFNAREYKTRLALKKDFTSGNAAKNARSLNTAVHHLETLKKAGEELQNRPVQWWNAVTNYGLEKLGDSRPTRYLNAATALSGELANVFKNTSGTDQEIKEWRNNISLAQSQDQINGNADIVIQLIGGRLAALTNQYEKGMGKPKDFTLLSQKSRDILRKIGVNVDEFDPVAKGVVPIRSGEGEVPSSSIPQGAIDYLKKNPALAGDFDKKYGVGASEKYLGVK